MTVVMRVVSVLLYVGASLGLIQSATDPSTPVRYAAGGVSILLVLAGVSLWSGSQDDADIERDRQRMREAAWRAEERAK